jgi:Spy/CpxP family protein refolding chaperone
MKRIKLLSVFLAVIVLVTAALAQTPAPGQAGPENSDNPFALFGLLAGGLGQRGPAPVPGAEPQVEAGGRGRGGRAGGRGTVAADQAVSSLNVSRGPIVTQVNGTWWSNAALLTELGLTDVQKARIQSSFDSHRQGLVSSKETLEKEELQLSRLLEAESLDRPAVMGQINRVIQARAEMERTNATMTLEMRQQLTRAQWMQLQTRTSAMIQTGTPGVRGTLGGVVGPEGGLGAGGGRGPRGAGGGIGPGTIPPPGQRSGGQQ